MKNGVKCDVNLDVLLVDPFMSQHMYFSRKSRTPRHSATPVIQASVSTEHFHAAMTQISGLCTAMQGDLPSARHPARCCCCCRLSLNESEFKTKVFVLVQRYPLYKYVYILVQRVCTSHSKRNRSITHPHVASRIPL